MKAMKVGIGVRALEARVNRALKKRGEKLVRKSGVYFLVNQGGIVDRDLELGGFAGKIGVLKSWEKLII